LQTIPFVHAAGYKLSSPREPIFHEAYFQNQRTVFPNALEVDYFIAYNGVMRWGASLEQVDPQFGCDWFPKMHFSKEARGFEGKMQLQTDGPTRLRTSCRRECMVAGSRSLRSSRYRDAH
jgi:hypothetical protein